MTQTRATDEQVPAFDVHDRCRKAREWAELDQETLAEKMGVARSTVSNYETGATKRVRRIVLKAWADATGVPFEWLTGADTRWYPETPTDLRESGRRSRCIRRRRCVGFVPRSKACRWLGARREESPHPSG